MNSDITQHTPGPWHVSPAYPDGLQVDAFSADGNRILRMKVESFHPEADARLASKAPDMAKLISALARLTKDGEDGYVMENNDAVDTLNAFITRARRIEAGQHTTSTTANKETL